MVPALTALPVGCKFQDRCPAVQDKCREVEPPLELFGGHLVRCHFPLEEAAWPSQQEA
jgi:oligopeptide/dipeptide ABC transporter ATP-binding protein